MFLYVSYNNPHNLILECFYHPQKKSNSNRCSFLVVSRCIRRQATTTIGLPASEISCEMDVTIHELPHEASFIVAHGFPHLSMW